jgi:hypothetical protein
VFPVVDLLDVHVLEVQGGAILIEAPSQSGVLRQLLVPLDVIDDGPVDKGQRGDLTVSRAWARAQGLL